MKPTPSEMMRAFLSADESYDGLFWAGVKTTLIFCKPSCSARKPKKENIEFFRSTKDAVFAGYRACKRCHPLREPSARPQWVTKLLKLAENTDRRVTAKDVRELSIDETRARRYFQRHFGMSFAEYARAQRLSRSLSKLNRGAKIDDVAFDGGYESLSGFRHAFAKKFGAPPGRARAKKQILSTLIDTPLGRLVAGATEDGVCLLEFTDRKMLEKQLKTVQKKLNAPIVPGRNAHLTRLAQELDEYFSGRRKEFGVPIVAPGSPLQEKVWRALREVPYGKTLSYARLAKKVGASGAARAVGTANGMNRMCIVIPCHRIVRESGALGGYSGGLARKQWLLDLEQKGTVQNDRP